MSSTEVRTARLSDRTRSWAEALTAIPSVTGSADEASFAAKLEALLRGCPAFAGRADRIWQIPVPGGRHPRACVLGLLRGRGKRTVVLTGHFDTVEIDCYGELKPLALDPHALRPALLEQLRREPATAANERAIADLESGTFIPGRGLLDMKAGLAIALAVIEDAALDPDRLGNILFVAVPDEEANSAGARAIAAALPEIARTHDLEFEAAINLDAIADDGDGAEGRIIALGSVGKLLPSALVVGRAAHASYTFRGLGAAALAGAIATEMEWATDLTERTGDELGAGPTLLGMKDSKRAYDVTMPQSVWMDWNIATHRRSPAEVLATVATHVRTAVDRLAVALEQRRVSVGAEGGPLPVEIVTFAELLAAAPDAANDAAALARSLAATGLDIPEQCRQVTEHLFERSGRSGPTVVLGFASTPYLPARLGEGPKARRLEHLARQAVAASEGNIGTKAFFPGISDVSFLGEAEESGLTTIGANTPVWNAALAWPPGSAIGHLPTVNIGPWGRDYHTRLERMHAGYAYDTLPPLIARLTRQLLDDAVEPEPATPR